MDKSLQHSLSEMQAQLFEKSGELGYKSEKFIKAFMNSDIAKGLDSEFDFMQWAGKEYILERIQEWSYHLHPMGKAKINGMLLAQESILKQYGYSVSQTDGITESQRRKLLALLIDYHILDKNSIIGYLDFFINQHLDSKFIVAVSKWEKDRDFICKYKNGSFQQIAIKSIKH